MSDTNFVPGTVIQSSWLNDVNDITYHINQANGAGRVGWSQGGIGSILRTVLAVLREKSASVKDFGAVGDGIVDDTAALILARDWAIGNLPATLIFPKGTYRYTNLGNLAYTGLTLKGLSDRESILKCVSTTPAHKAILLDAFASGSPTDPFIQRCNLKNLTIEGNALTAKIIEVQGLARCNWENVIVRTAEPIDGIGVHLKGVQLSRFTNLICSTDLDTMATMPSVGLLVEEGRRATISIGNSSNNVFSSLYMEGMPIGVRILGGDQNIFLGGSPESNTTYGLLIGPGCRYNTFIGTGFESSASTADIGDAGISTQYINIYSSKAVILQGQGAQISGGYFERIEVQAGAKKNTVSDVTLNHWATGVGGWYDSGDDTTWHNLFDEDTGLFIYPHKDRTSITVGASPFRYTNTTGRTQTIVFQTGTVTQILHYRGTDNWQCQVGNYVSHDLPPGDQLDVSYSVIPLMSAVPRNGLQG